MKRCSTSLVITEMQIRIMRYCPTPTGESVNCSVISDSATLWTAACQTPLSMEFSRKEYWEWVAMPFSRGSSQPRDQIQVSLIAGWFFTARATREANTHKSSYQINKQIDISVGKDKKKLENLHITGRNIKWLTPCGK